MCFKIALSTLHAILCANIYRYMLVLKTYLARMFDFNISFKIEIMPDIAKWIQNSRIALQTNILYSSFGIQNMIIGVDSRGGKGVKYVWPPQLSSILFVLIIKSANC